MGADDCNAGAQPWDRLVSHPCSGENIVKIRLLVLQQQQRGSCFIPNLHVIAARSIYGQHYDYDNIKRLQTSVTTTSPSARTSALEKKKRIKHFSLLGKPIAKLRSKGLNDNSPSYFITSNKSHINVSAFCSFTCQGSHIKSLLGQFQIWLHLRFCQLLPITLSSTAINSFASLEGGHANFTPT